MTQPVTPWMPGQAPLPGMNYGRLNLPGVSPPAPGAPFGMQPGQRHVLPDQINLDEPDTVKPDDIKLDEQAPPGGAQAASPVDQGPVTGYRIRNAKGEVVSDIPIVNTQEYQRSQVQKVADALSGQAITPDDKESASRTGAYMLSMVGQMPVSEITKRGIAQYDADQRNGISRAVQEAKDRRAAMMGHGGPVGPTKEDKFDEQKGAKDADLTERIVGDVETKAKLASLQEYENDLERLKEQMSSGNPLSQRTAVMGLLQTLSGKQSTDVERRQISQAAGIIERLKNEVSLWTDDPALTDVYRDKFLENVAQLQNAVVQRRNKIGEAAAWRITHQPRFAGRSEAEKKQLADYARGTLTGQTSEPAPVAVPADIDPKLKKYLK